MRNVTEVFEDHLHKRLTGKVEEDIKTNYSPDVILLTGTGAYVGHEGVSESAKELASYIEGAEFVYNHTLVKISTHILNGLLVKRMCSFATAQIRLS